MALELVSGADFLCKIDVREAPGRSKGVPGSISGLKPRRTQMTPAMLWKTMGASRRRLVEESLDKKLRDRGRLKEDQQMHWQAILGT